jgi:hypothetical protein
MKKKGYKGCSKPLKKDRNDVNKDNRQVILLLS